jgi:hypothetical protein
MKYRNTQQKQLVELYTLLEEQQSGHADLAKIAKLAGKLGFEYLDLSSKSSVNSTMDEIAGTFACIDLGV